MRRYLANCFWLLVPVLLVNAAWTDRLPERLHPDLVWRLVPWWIVWPETVLRVLVVALPALMPLDLSTRRRRTGFRLYLAGMAVYVISWAPLLWLPQSDWSRSVLGLVMPAMTPAVWLAGIALVGDRYFWALPLPRALYAVIALAFLAFHNAATLLTVLAG